MSKAIALGFLFISLMGAKGRKNEKLHYKTAFTWLLCGQAIFWSAGLVLYAPLEVTGIAFLYMAITTLGFIMTITGGTILSRIITKKMNDKDIFNKENETFPQEERLLENEYSINLPAKYMLKGKIRHSKINIINPFRGLLVSGSPGS